MLQSRTHAAAALAVLALALAAGPAAAQADAAKYPTRPIRLIVPFPPGGSNDIIGRLIAQKLTERIGQQTIVDNRPGADGIIGSELTARAQPDGHTLLIVSTSYTMNPAVHKLPFDPVKALIPVSLIGSGSNVIAVTPSLPWKTVKDLIAHAKANPGKVRYASSGIGGFNHFGGELFNTMAGIKMTHIPYKGGGPAMLDVMTGQVEVVFGTLTQAMPHLRSGKLRGLGVGSAKRSAAMPELPTIAESGLPGYDASIWWGLLAPAGTPPAIVARVNKEVAGILADPDMVKRLAADAAEPVIATPEAFGKQIVADIAKWKRIAKEAGIRAE